MKKIVKKGRKQTRRRIRNTVASLFMATAIVVAALPVENMGSTRAAVSRPSVSPSNSAAYTTAKNAVSEGDDSFKTASEESGYSTDIIVQRIETSGSSKKFINAYKAKANGSDAIISKYIGEAVDNFQIKTVEYYNYVYFDDVYTNKLNELLRNETYRLTFTEIANAYTFGGGTYVENSNSITLRPINLDMLSEEEDEMSFYYDNAITDSIDLTGSEAAATNPYTKIIAFRSSDNISITEELFKKCMPNIYTQQVDLVKKYNQYVESMASTLQTIQNKLDRSETPTSQDYADWERIRTEVESATGKYQKDFNTASKVEYTYNELDDKSLFDKNANQISDIAEFMITQRATTQEGTSLKNYELDQVGMQNEYIFIPKLKAGAVFESGQFIDDDNRYLAGGKINIVGIGGKNIPDVSKGAFDNAPIYGVTIPNSITFIGEGAFKACPNLKSVTLEDKNCTKIGDEAFSSCKNLEKFVCTGDSGLRNIGMHAFYETNALTEIVFPRAIENIGFGAFEKSGIKTISFNTPNNNSYVNIGAYAFYDCNKLTDVAFPNNLKFHIRTGAFSVSDAEGANAEMTEFTFPSTINNIAESSSDRTKNDYILAGRQRLKKVTFPTNLGNSADGYVPDNTFEKCYSLEQVIFPDGAGDATYDPDKLFYYVNNESGNFCVIGPRLGSNSQEALTRKTTWKAKDANNAAVPYQYNYNGSTYWEYGVFNDDGEAPFVASIKVLDSNNKTAMLSKYMQNPDYTSSASDKFDIVIPDNVNDYRIVEIGSNCLDSGMSEKVYKINIGDNVIKIDDSAFENTKGLQWVNIGASIENIGSKAFYDCPLLKDVVFSQGKTKLWGDEDAYWSTLQIGTDAFKTLSDVLTFHGAIHPDYAPYKLAMSDLSADMTKAKTQICYKTDAPLNLVVLRDNTTGESTLVDYPHFAEIDELNKDYVETQKSKYLMSAYSLTDKFLHIKGVKADATYNSFDTLDSEEENIVNQTIYLNLPKGIDSIDSVSYFKNAANKADILAYFNKFNKLNSASNGYEQDTFIRKINTVHTSLSSYQDVKNLYSETDKGIVATDPVTDYVTENGTKVVHPGFFSGFFYETIDAQDNIFPAPLNNHTFVEKYKAGNDYLRSVDAQTVKSLPDYTFESCENLETVTFGSTLDEVGELPFKGDKSMKDITLLNNNKFYFENMIFYENLEPTARATGKYKIIEVLEGVGNDTETGFGSKYLDAESNPNLANVYEIAEGAFIDCNYLTNVDISTSSVKTIPEKCFYSCDNLSNLELPKTVNRIDDNSFADTNVSAIITVPNPLCVISDKIFGATLGENQVMTIRGVQYIDEGSGETSPCYESVVQLQKAFGEKKVVFKPIGKSYTVTFVDMDLNVIERFDVDSGTSLSNPPSAPKVSGYKFKDWKCVIGDTVLAGEAAYSDVKENRTVIATYETDPSSVVSDGKAYTLTISGEITAIIGDSLYTSTNDKATNISPIYGGESVLLSYTGKEKFSNWSTAAAYVGLLKNSTQNPTTLTMPNANITIVAMEGVNNSSTTPDNNNGNNNNNNGNNNNNSGNNNTDNNNSSSDTTYELTVNYGSGSGKYKAGDVVTITAYAPESNSKVFSKWTAGSTNVAFASATASTTTIVMPKSNEVVTANYKTRSSDDLDDDEQEAIDRRKNQLSQGSSTVNTSTTITTKPADTTTTTNTNTTTPSNDDKLYINKNGISNKDVGSASVDGSSDNFVVRITDSDEATAAVQDSLRNRYGTLDGIVYFPMDISLYDSTGNHKILDTYGLDVQVTMPIPDALIQYGGNAKVAAADNGYLQILNAKFTTIDGIACITFTPPHFSPYVIYVDTNNLIAGLSYDQTPQTGDPIHPKWFLAIGFACISVFLFVTGDKKKKVRVRTA